MWHTDLHLRLHHVTFPTGSTRGNMAADEVLCRLLLWFLCNNIHSWYLIIRIWRKQMTDYLIKDLHQIISLILKCVCVPGVQSHAEALRPIGGESPTEAPPLSLSHQSHAQMMTILSLLWLDDRRRIFKLKLKIWIVQINRNYLSVFYYRNKGRLKCLFLCS